MSMDEMDRLEARLSDDGVIVDDRLLRRRNISGLYIADSTGSPPIILINGGLEPTKRLCVLAEEAGHHYRSSGPALDKGDSTQRKNEQAGRDWACVALMPLERLVKSWCAGNTTVYDLAEDIGVTEDFLRSAIDYYHRKNGVLTTWKRWIIQFDPYFDIYLDR